MQQGRQGSAVASDRTPNDTPPLIPSASSSTGSSSRTDDESVSTTGCLELEDQDEGLLKSQTKEEDEDEDDEDESGGLDYLEQSESLDRLSHDEDEEDSVPRHEPTQQEQQQQQKQQQYQQQQQQHYHQQQLYQQQQQQQNSASVQRAAAASPRPISARSPRSSTSKVRDPSDPLMHSEDPNRQYVPEMETQETLKRERTRILSRPAISSYRRINYRDITNIKPLKKGGFGEIHVAEWSRLRVVLKRALTDHGEGEEQFAQEVSSLL